MCPRTLFLPVWTAFLVDSVHIMENSCYNFAEKADGSLWWYQVRSNILYQLICSYRQHYDNMLDIGCGTGAFLRRTKDITSNRVGIDQHEYSTRDYTVLIGDALSLPFEKNRFDLVTMLDVLEHIPESDKALDEVKRVLKDQDSLFLLTVPAYQALYSPFDKNSHHVCRYNKKQLVSKLEQNGFHVLRCTYFNTLLFPLEAPVRLIEKAINKELSIGMVDPNKHSISNQLFYRIFQSETLFLKKHDLPFGLSLAALAVLRK